MGGRQYRADQAVLLSSGREVPADDPRTAQCWKREHWLRDQLALSVRGLVEARLDFGQADVMTPKRVFEVEHVKSWGKGAQQVLAYAYQTKQRPVLALFGEATHRHVRVIYEKCLANKMHLWWHVNGRWKYISEGQRIQAMAEPRYDLVEKEVTTFLGSAQGSIWSPHGQDIDVDDLLMSFE